MKARVSTMSTPGSAKGTAASLSVGGVTHLAGTAHFASDMRVLSAIEYDRSAPQVPRQLVDAEPAAVVQAEAEGSARPAAVVQVESDRSAYFSVLGELLGPRGMMTVPMSLSKVMMSLSRIAIINET